MRIFEKTLLGTLRLCMGWIFFWAFIDKVFGLGFATTAEQAWMNGGSPTYGFLTFATKGPFEGFYKSLAGSVSVDWLFMLGLLFVGVSLLLGIVVRLGSVVGVALLLLMYTAASIFPEHNPFLDEHLIYAALLLLFAVSESGRYFGFGRVWSESSFVKRFPFLQ